MSTNLIHLLQKKLGSFQMQKIDPNTQEIQPAKALTEQNLPEKKLMQAVIATVCTGIYKFTKDRKGAGIFLRGSFSTEPLYVLFEENTYSIVSKIANYASVSENEVINKMNEAINEAKNIIQANIVNNKTTEQDEDKIIEYMKNQRNNILPYLPAALQMGELLNDNTIDDHTHKMDGPISGLMHYIEKAFSGNSSSDEVKK